MKIVCEACQAKYSIADDKVRGKVFKIRCKKCSHVIVVRGAEGANSASGEFASSPSSAPDLALDAGWHIVVDGEQVGPLSEGDIKSRLVRGEITPETYIWKEGLADWVKISTLAEFASEADSGGGPFTGAGAEPGGLFAGAPTNVVSPGAHAAHADVFAAPAASAGGGGDLFAAPARASVDNGATQVSLGGGGGGGSPYVGYDPGLPGGGGGGQGGLTGQRHENSVLFSLSNLEALAKPSHSSLPAARGSSSSASNSTTEGSGLIDIRAMANMTLGGSAARPESRASDLPAFSAPQFSPVAPMLLTPQSSFPRWVIGALLVAAAVIIAGLIVVSAKLFSPRPAPVAVAPPVATPAPVPAVKVLPPAGGTAPGATAAAPPVTPPPANEALPPREAPAGKAEGAGDRHGAAAHAGKLPRGAGAAAGKRGGKPVDDAVNNRLAGAFAPAPPRPAAEEKPRKPKDDIEALLEAAAGGGRKRAPAREAEEPAAAPAGEKAPPLGRDEIVRGMNGVLPKARECYAQFKVPGVANAKITVDPRGRVSAVNVSGKFAGTPSGNCVESAIKSAKFAPSGGLTFDYPVPLR